jgi:4-amino-4-deoxy-L-arabinose transferase-like glycosyltransferase
MSNHFSLLSTNSRRILIKFPEIILGISFLMFIYFSSQFIFNFVPYDDEGLDISPAFNLMHYGHMGTSQADYNDSVKRHTYWEMPLYYLLQTVWLKVWGIGLFQARFLSLVFGIFLLCIIYFIAKKSFNNRWVGVLSVYLISIDWHFYSMAGLARFDMVSAALGYGSLGSYLYQREKNLSTAILTSSSLIVLSGLTHPFGLIYLPCLLLFMARDIRQICGKHIFLFFLPFILGGVLWGSYILQNPQAFIKQFTINSSPHLTYDSKISLFQNLLNRTQEFFRIIGFENSDVVFNRQRRALFFTIYIPGMLTGMYCLFIKKRIARLLSFTLILIVIFTIFFVRKDRVYAPHLVPIFCLFFAFLFTSVYQRFSALRVVAIGIVAVITGMSAWHNFIFYTHEKPYNNYYVPVIQTLKESVAEKASIEGPPELAFDIGFDYPKFTNNTFFGLDKGERPEIIVINGLRKTLFDNERGSAKSGLAASINLVDNILQKEYDTIFSNCCYTIYRLR